MPLKSYFIRHFYDKYRDIILFNKNIIIAAIVTAVIDVLIVGYAVTLYPNGYFLISAISLIADFAIYNALFIALFFVDNRKRYVGAGGKMNKQKIKEDGKKLITALGISEFGYLATKFLSTYIMFAYTPLGGSQISIITTILAWVTYLTSANILIKKQHFFNNVDKSHI